MNMVVPPAGVVNFRVFSLPGALLSCSAKKVTKECGIGEALTGVLPPPQAPSPMYPTRALLTEEM